MCARMIGPILLCFHVSSRFSGLKTTFNFDEMYQCELCEGGHIERKSLL